MAIKTLCCWLLGIAVCQGQDFERVDAHVHVFQAAPEYFQMLGRLNMRILTVCVVDKHDKGYEEAEPQHVQALEVARKSHGRAAWCSTFDPHDWETPGFAERSIKSLDRTFQDGAVAVKIYKDIGMELKSADGRYVMPDDPVFSPILEAIAARHKTVFAHLAEPLTAWKPVDPAATDSYYKKHPEWNMFLYPDRPKKDTILAARDRMLRAHPKLRVVGCHLGSMEEDVDEIAKRLDLYPNFAVDTAARVSYLMLQPRDKVRAFCIKYQDRILYGTDAGLMTWDNPAEVVKRLESQYSRDWQYFATDQLLEFRGGQVRGLALPATALRKIFRDNAAKWVPGF